MQAAWNINEMRGGRPVILSLMGDSAGIPRGLEELGRSVPNREKRYRVFCLSVLACTLMGMSGRRAKAKRRAAQTKGRQRQGWTLSGGAVEARRARISTVEYLRTAEIARVLQM